MNFTSLFSAEFHHLQDKRAGLSNIVKYFGQYNFRHSMVLYNDLSMIYIIGGYQDRKLSNRTWIVDLSNGFTIKEGPSMNFARSCHATGKIKVNGKTLLVVAGGEFKPGHISDSVEILDPLTGNGWIQGLY